MILLFEGINPEPWRSPRLGTKRVGRKVVPVAFKDENLRSYQEAIKETATDFLTHREFDLPVFASGTPLAVEMYFWRQLERYHGESRTHSRNRADVTNMQKALEDALQGVLYATDRHNVMVRSELVEAADQTPRILVACGPTRNPPSHTCLLTRVKFEGQSDGSGLWMLED